MMTHQPVSPPVLKPLGEFGAPTQSAAHVAVLPSHLFSEQGPTLLIHSQFLISAHNCSDTLTFSPFQT